MNTRPPAPLRRRLWLWLTVWLVPALTAPAAHSIRVALADGFDLPVGKPDGTGYYVFRGYAPYAHQGEDWNGNGGGNSDLGDPVYACADGVVVYSEDYRRSWGHLVIVRHAFRAPDGSLQMVDSLYGHLDRRSVRLYQMVKRGQVVGTIGTAHGLYAAHLHFEIRKNLQIGPYQTSFARDYSNYYSPRQFISQRRRLRAGGAAVVPVDTFAGQGRPAAAANANAGSARTPAPGTPVDPVRRNIPTRRGESVVPENGRDERELARAAEIARLKREEELRKLVEEHRRKVANMKEEDMDEFWQRVRSRLGKKLPPPQ